MKMHVSEVTHYDEFEYKVPLRRRLWRWLLCWIKGHTPGCVYWSTDGVWELCGRCSKITKVGKAIKREPQVLYFSGPPLDPDKFPDLHSHYFGDSFPPAQDSKSGTGMDSESGDKKSN